MGASHSSIDQSVYTLLSQISPQDTVKIIQTYITHAFQPVVDVQGLRSLLIISLMRKENVTDKVDTLTDSLWTVFENPENQICYIQEILVCFILLIEDDAAVTWSVRFGWLFDAFKSLGNEIVGYDDILLMCHVVTATLCKLWKEPMVSSQEVFILATGIADHAYTKLGIADIEDGFDKERLVFWAADRFRDSKSISNLQQLLSMFESPYLIDNDALN